jgi:hypothetical protein
MKMGRKNIRVGVTDFQGIPNAHLIISGRWRDEERDFCKAMVSFLYDGGDFAAEWEPEHGPIQTWEKCTKDHPKAKEHYFYEYVVDVGLNWSQLAVNENHLPEMFTKGDYEWIFNVLKRWTQDREHKEIESS